MDLIFSAWKWNGDNTIHLAQLIDRFEESYGSEMRSRIQFFNDTDATSFDDVINFSIFNCSVYIFNNVFFAFRGV
jgi:hypothetical protein